MTLQLRQICLVAAELEPVLQDLTDILGINRCFVDPGVGKFGLENTLMPIGRNFLEVVAPLKEGTAAGRYLQRRKGDGGYMVITQADSKESQQVVRQNALDNGVRIAFESLRDDWNLCQLHPGDMKAAFLEIESDAFNDFQGYWHPAGGTGWESKVKQDVCLEIIGVELQGEDPEALAALWAKVVGVPFEKNGEEFQMKFSNAAVRFIEETDGRGPGLSGLDITVTNLGHVLSSAKQRRCYVNDRQVDIGGVHWYLTE